MRTHTQDFKKQIKELGRQIDSRISYGNNIILADQLFNINPIINGNILKSAMKELHFESSVQVPQYTILKYEFGLKVNGEYEYLDYGNYIVNAIEYNEDTKTYKHTCYDSMLFSMKEYTTLQNGSFPMTIREYLTRLCLDCGLVFKNANDTFANYNKVIQSDLYANLGYTYRDIFDELAQVTASTICIDKNNMVEVRYINDTNDIIDTEYLKDINVTFGQKYGPINSIVLSRSAESDNVYLQDEDSIKNNGLCELKIIDNQIMNDNNRSDYLSDILSKLNGLEYYLNDYTSTGVLYYELCDRYSVKIEDKTYSCIIFNDEPEITQGIVENIFTEMPEETQTDYKKADKTDRKINQTYLIVDKQNQEIKGLISKVETTVEDITTTTQTSTGSNELCITDSLESNAIEYHVEGKSEQETRSGKNLYNVKDKSTVSAHATIDNDDWITISCDNTFGSSTVYTNYWTNNLNVEANTNYNIITEVKSVNVVAGNPTLHAASYNTAANGQFLTSVAYNFLALVNGDVKQKIATTKTTLENVVDGLRSFISFPAGSSGSITFRISVLEDTTITADTFEYEQYGASPSPDYPSEIKTIPSIRNLFDKNNINYIKGYITGEGAVWVDNNDNVNKTFYIKIKPNTTYTISKKAEKRFRVTTFSSIPAVTTQGNVSYNNNTSSRCTITTGNDDNYLFVYYYVSNDYTLTEQEILDSIMIEEGSIAHDYVPYGTWLKTKITGKNLLPKDLFFDYTINGITYTNNGDGTITANGTATSNSFFAVNVTIPAGTYTLSGSPNGAGQDKYLIQALSYGTGDIGNGQTFTLTKETKLTLRIMVWAGITVNNIVFKPMLEESSIATNFETYKEQEVLIDLSKPNLFDKDNTNILNVSINVDKNIATSSNAKTLYIPCQPNTTYTVSKIVSNRFRLATTSDIPAPSIASINYIANDTASVSTITTSSNAKYLCVYYFLNGTDTLTEKEILDSIKIYEGYNDYYELSSIGDTKDTLDIVNGQVVIDKKIDKVVLENFTWSGTVIGETDYSLWRCSNIPNIKYVSSNQIVGNGLAEKYIMHKGSGMTNAQNCLDIDTSMIIVNAKESPTGFFCYELAEPQQITLSNTQIPLFEGVNHISLIEDVETNTTIKYYRKTPISNDYVIQQQLDATNSDLADTTNKTNQNASDINKTNNNLNNNYYNKEQIDVINSSTEQIITQIRNEVEATTSATNLQISVLQEQLTNGVTAVKTETGYTFDKDGLKIAKSDSEMNLLLDNDGMEVKRNETEVLTVRSDGVETENLKVRTYFTVGNNTRVEDYKNGTGFFYIGGDN